MLSLKGHERVMNTIVLKEKIQVLSKNKQTKKPVYDLPGDHKNGKYF